MDWTPILIALIAGLPGIITALMQWHNKRAMAEVSQTVAAVSQDVAVVSKDVKVVAHEMNSMKDQQIALTAKASFAEGVLAEKEGTT